MLAALIKRKSQTYTIAEALWLVARVQQRHHRAFLSHRKRRHPEPHVK